MSLTATSIYHFNNSIGRQGHHHAEPVLPVHLSQMYNMINKHIHTHTSIPLSICVYIYIYIFMFLSLSLSGFLARQGHHHAEPVLPVHLLPAQDAHAPLPGKRLRNEQIQ